MLPSGAVWPRSVESIPYNLPVELTTFVGRERERADVTSTMAQTLTGRRGCGTSRLAARAATELWPRFRDGVWRVELDPVTDPGAVGLALAHGHRWRSFAAAKNRFDPHRILGPGTGIFSP